MVYSHVLVSIFHIYIYNDDNKDDDINDDNKDDDDNEVKDHNDKFDYSYDDNNEW